MTHLSRWYSKGCSAKRADSITATALCGSDGDPDNLAGTWSRDGDRLRVMLGHPGYDHDDELSGSIGDGFIRLKSTAMGGAEAVTFHRQGD